MRILTEETVVAPIAHPLAEAIVAGSAAAEAALPPKMAPIKEKIIVKTPRA